MSFNVIDPNEDTESRVVRLDRRGFMCRFNVIDPNEDTERICNCGRLPPPRSFNVIDPNEDTERLQPPGATSPAIKFQRNRSERGY